MVSVYEFSLSNYNIKYWTYLLTDIYIIRFFSHNTNKEKPGNVIFENLTLEL